MRQMLTQVKNAWLNEEFASSISSFQSFCAMLGMERLPEFLSANDFRGVQDWSDQPLGSEGQAIQANITERTQVRILIADERMLLTVRSVFLCDSQKPCSLRPRKNFAMVRPRIGQLRRSGQKPSR